MLQRNAPPIICKLWRTLKELKLSWNGTLHASTKLLTRSICDNLNDIRILALTEFSMAVACLAEALSQSRHLQILNLSDTRNLDTTGVRAIAASLVNCTSLKELHLNSCRLDSQGAIALSLCLQNYQNLRILSLYDNDTISDVGVRAITANLHHCTRLERVDLRNSGLNISSKHEAMSTLKHLGIQDFSLD